MVWGRSYHVCCFYMCSFVCATARVSKSEDDLSVLPPCGLWELNSGLGPGSRRLHPLCHVAMGGALGAGCQGSLTVCSLAGRKGAWAELPITRQAVSLWPLLCRLVWASVGNVTAAHILVLGLMRRSVAREWPLCL